MFSTKKTQAWIKSFRIMMRSGDGSRSTTSAASSGVSPDITSLQDQVLWGGFAQLKKADGYTQVLLLAFETGFQVWDVTKEVRCLVSARCAKVSLMQSLPNPEDTESEDRFSQMRPLLAVCASDNSGSAMHCFSLSARSLVHSLRFQAIVHAVRCSSRMVAVLQPAQIHCFDARTLVEKYRIDTKAIEYGPLGVGYGPLAVGPQWIAYLPGLEGTGVTNVRDADNRGMVIIKDITSQNLVTKFQAHMGPISALSFDRSGTILVTASLRGQNLHVFRIIPSASTSKDANTASSVHIFKLRRGFTKAVIQDISFSQDSCLIVISSSGGTTHLFEIDPKRESNAKVPLIISSNVGEWMGDEAPAARDSLPGATATFCENNLLIFGPCGYMTKYVLEANPVGAKPIRRWHVTQHQCRRREMQDNHSVRYSGGGDPEEAHYIPSTLKESFRRWRRTKLRPNDFAPGVGAIPHLRLPQDIDSDED